MLHEFITRPMKVFLKRFKQFMRTLFTPLGDRGKKKTNTNSSQGIIVEKKKVEKENGDHVKIRSIIGEILNLTSSYKVEVISVREGKLEVDGLLKVIPQFRVNIRAKNYNYDDCRLFLWRTFWVSKVDGGFEFKPDLKLPQVPVTNIKTY